MQGMCFAMWLDPAKVPDVAEDVMSDAGHTFPLLLANRVRAQCCERMGRRFDAIMKGMPQVMILSLLTFVQLTTPLVLKCQPLIIGEFYNKFQQTTDSVFPIYV